MSYRVLHSYNYLVLFLFTHGVQRVSADFLSSRMPGRSFKERAAALLNARPSVSRQLSRQASSSLPLRPIQRMPARTAADEGWQPSPAGLRWADRVTQHGLAIKIRREFDVRAGIGSIGIRLNASRSRIAAEAFQLAAPPAARQRVRRISRAAISTSGHPRASARSRPSPASGPCPSSAAAAVA